MPLAEITFQPIISILRKMYSTVSINIYNYTYSYNMLTKNESEKLSEVMQNVI